MYFTEHAFTGMVFPEMARGHNSNTAQGDAATAAEAEGVPSRRGSTPVLYAYEDDDDDGGDDASKRMILN